MLKQKLEELGFEFLDTYKTSAGYLLEDGTFLNLQNQKVLGTGNKACHGMLDAYIQNNNLIKDFDQYKNYNKSFRPKFIAWGNIRILRYTDNACTLNDGSAFITEGVFIDLPPKMPEGKQLEQLILWIDNLHYRKAFNKRHLDVSLENEVKHFELDQDSTDDIIKEIKKMYNKIV